MTIPAMQTTPSSHRSNGGRLVTADGRTLPLRGAAIAGDASAGVARVTLTQRFHNAFPEPLHVTYLMPLPADGAVSGYAFTIGDRRIVGEVDRKQAARERFEQALSEGRSAGIVEEERSSLFTQELGNIPPGAEVVAELTIDQPLTWIADGGWEWRFPTAVGPRYQGAPGRVADAAKTEVAVADAPLPVTIELALMIRDRLPSGRKPESPSHALATAASLDGLRVALAQDGGVRLDRDLVVRWAAATPSVGVSLAVGRPARGDAAYGLVTLVPPTPETAVARPRDLILLLDTSGSMGGAPLDQVKRVCAALIDSLGPSDRLEMIEFSTDARRWHRGAVSADEKQKRKAHEWLAKLSASGGTEMVKGVMEALAPLGDEGQRQVVLLTDGYIGFETEVVRAIAEKLPRGSRLHVVGVGSSVNRSLTSPSARAGRGAEVVIGIDEDPERAARRLVARTAQPLVTDVEIDGDAVLAVAPARLPDLLAGSPALAAVKLAPAGGRLRVRGRTASGIWEQSVTVAPADAGKGLGAAAALFGRESIEDLELARAAGGNQADCDARIEKIGLELQISSRLTTWVAIAEEASVDPSHPTRRALVPQELPHGVSAEGVGLRATRGTTIATGMITGQFQAVAPAPMMAAPGGFAPPPPPAKAAPRRTMMFGGGAKKMDADDAKQAEKPKELSVDRERNMTRAGSVMTPARTLRGKVRLAKDGQVVIEIEIDGDLDWKVGATVICRSREGSFVAGPVVAAGTTKAGRLSAGQRARLVLQMTEAPALIYLDDVAIEVE